MKSNSQNLVKEIKLVSLNIEQENYSYREMCLIDRYTLDTAEEYRDPSQCCDPEFSDLFKFIHSVFTYVHSKHQSDLTHVKSSFIAPQQLDQDASIFAGRESMDECGQKVKSDEKPVRQSKATLSEVEIREIGEQFIGIQQSTAKFQFEVDSDQKNKLEKKNKEIFKNAKHR